ncbi:MAG: site-specific DNA-methyltransferase [Nitrospirae bacterium]|nr:site-specific DNA-methyltransferase [Nitrospirota bacterium]
MKALETINPLFKKEDISICKAHPINAQSSGFRLHYEHPNGKLYQGDSIAWLNSLKDESIDLIFADPPYNINKADWDSFESQEHYIEWSLKWIEPSARILKPHGSLYICGFSEILADLRHPTSKYFKSCRWLIWHYKNKANLGNDWGRSHESIVHFRKSSKVKLNVDDIRIPYGAHTLKYPLHPQAVTSQYGNGEHREHWKPNPRGAKPKDVIDIPTTCNGMGEKTPHPTQKPEELVRKFVLASSNKGDVVLDPFSGSGTTLVVAEQLGRKWSGCEINAPYNEWAIERVEHVKSMSVEDWIEHDRKVQERRESIR